MQLELEKYCVKSAELLEDLQLFPDALGVFCL